MRRLRRGYTTPDFKTGGLHIWQPYFSIRCYQGLTHGQGRRKLLRGEAAITARAYPLASPSHPCLSKKKDSHMAKISFMGLAGSSINSSRNLKIYIYKHASLACAARLADTLYPPDALFGRLESH